MNPSNPRQDLDHEVIPQSREEVLLWLWQIATGHREVTSLQFRAVTLYCRLQGWHLARSHTPAPSAPSDRSDRSDRSDPSGTSSQTTPPDPERVSSKSPRGGIDLCDPPVVPGASGGALHADPKPTPSNGDLIASPAPDLPPQSPPVTATLPPAPPPPSPPVRRAGPHHHWSPEFAKAVAESDKLRRRGYYPPPAPTLPPSTCAISLSSIPT